MKIKINATRTVADENKKMKMKMKMWNLIIKKKLQLFLVVVCSPYAHIS